MAEMIQATAAGDMVVFFCMSLLCVSLSCVWCRVVCVLEFELVVGLGGIQLLLLSWGEDQRNQIVITSTMPVCQGLELTLLCNTLFIKTRSWDQVARTTTT
jgi:hypothetical protein